jgi:serine/threonine-protein kinase
MTDNPDLAGLALALRLEQARRWRNQDHAPAEAYLARHPELGANPEYALEVVYGELLLREEQGETPPVEEFLQRFPQFAGQVQQLFDLHQAVRAASVVESHAADIHQQDTHLESAAAAAGMLPTLQGFAIREELGRGGMGIVLVCRDHALSRDLAVKILRQEHQGNPVAEQRFLEEAQITGQLQHPGVVPVHQVGRLRDRRPYFTMKLVRGQTLAVLLQGRTDPGQDRPRFLAVFQQVCQTLAYAHARRVVHRDLKPLNVMVGAFDEVQVMDWGLAKVLAENSAGSTGLGPADGDEIHTVRTEAPETASRTGTVLGTPAYMAPEQARGAVDRLDERCDVFGLGAILCEILTGQPPYAGEAIAEVYHQAQQGDLSGARSRLEACGADGELVRLAQHCLAADAAARPRDAGAVARALMAHLNSVQERLRQAEMERAAAQARAKAERKARRWTVIAAAAVLAVVSLGGGAALWWFQQVEVAKRQVTSLLDEHIEPMVREGKWPEALAVASRANDLLAGGRVPIDVEERVRARLADAKMMVQLERVHLSQFEIKDGHQDLEATARGYAEAFRDYGIDVETLEQPEAVARLRQRDIREHLVAVLEDWTRMGVASSLKTRLLAIAEEAASEELRAELRAARNTEDRQALQQLADSINVRKRSARALLHLSIALYRNTDTAVAVTLLRRAQQQYPGDFSLNMVLASNLYRMKPPQLDDAIRFYTAAVALRSRTPGIHYELANVLSTRGQRDQAIAHYEQALLLDNKLDRVHINLGNALRSKGLPDEALAHYRAALQLDPRNTGALNGIGTALANKKQWDEALAYYQKALELDPHHAYAHYNRGDALIAKKQLEEAIAAFQEAIRCQPDLAEAHNRLGLTLYQQNRMDESVAALQEAIRVKPEFAEAHVHLGIAFLQVARLDDALTTFQKALRLKPDYAHAHVGLGIALDRKGRLDEGIAALREGIRLQPDEIDPLPVLGVMLQRKGAFADALAVFRKAYELCPKGTPQAQQVGQSLRETERLVELDGKLAAIMEGATHPADAAERMEYANLCTVKKLPATAAQFFVEAFAAHPALAEDLKAGNRYNAACVAALAGCGQGNDEPPLDDPARARWRQQALAWLRADLGLWTKHLDSGNPQAQAALQQTLLHWQHDPDLAGIREPTALGRLPEAERQACRQLWAEVKQAARVGKR